MPGGGQTRVRAGRRNGPLAGRSPEGDALAAWLREITAGRTLNELVAQFGTYKRATWGEFRNGHKPIPLGLLRTVVTTLITEPRRQGVELKRGGALHRAAAAAAAAQDRASTDGATLPVRELQLRELQLRLDEARRGHIEVQQVLLDNKDTIRVLEATIISLEDRCAQLEAERDRALRQARSVAAVERDLEAFGKVLARTEQRLELALQDRGSAEVLLVDVRRRAEGYRHELQALQQAGPAGTGAEPRPEGAAGDGQEKTQARTAPDARRQPQQWEYELLLETVDDSRQTQRESLTGVRQRMDIAAPLEQAVRRADVLAGTVTVVHPHDMDNVDNPPDRGAQASAGGSEETSGADDSSPRPLPDREPWWRRRPGLITAATTSAPAFHPGRAQRRTASRRLRGKETARGAAPRWLPGLAAVMLIGLSATTSAPPLAASSADGDKPESSPSVKNSEPVPPEQWTTALAPFATLGPISGRTQFVQDSKNLRAINTTTGRTLWSKPAPGTTGGTMAFGDDTLYATDDSTTIQARNGTTGALRWSRNLSSLLPAAAEPARRSFISDMSEPKPSHTTSDVVFVSFWRSQLPAPLPQETAAEPGIVPSVSRALPAMCVTYGCASGTPQSFISAPFDEVTAAVSTRTGAVIWQTGGEFLAQAGQTCLVSDADGTRGVDCGTGTVHWSIDSDCDAAVVTDAGTAAVCTAHGFVYRINVDSGRQVWESSAVPTPQGPPQAAHETIYLTNGDGRLYALDQVTGETRWSAAAGRSTSSPVPDQSQVYVAGADGRLYAFDGATGARDWSAPAGGHITTEPRVSGGSVYVGAQDGRVYALNRTTGERRWSASAGGGAVEALHTSGGRVTTLTEQNTARHR